MLWKQEDQRFTSGLSSYIARSHGERAISAYFPMEGQELQTETTSISALCQKTIEKLCPRKKQNPQMQSLHICSEKSNVPSDFFTLL